MRHIVRLFLPLLLTPCLWAQKPPAIELGFKANAAYDVNGVDNVNLFNGNVIINIPLGLRYPVSGALDYQLTLAYNSKAWDYRHGGELESTGPWTWALPNLKSNAGMGWRVGFGQLYAPGLTPIPLGRWTYEGPAGDEHAFSEDADAAVQLTTDGSNLRLVKISPSVVHIEFPDGRYQRFGYERSAWRLIGIHDRFGNAVSIAYGYVVPSSTTDHRVSTWTITDSASSRTHVVNFDVADGYSADMAQGAFLGMNVTSIQFAGVEDANGNPRTYTVEFDYGPLVEVPFGCLHDYTIHQPGHPDGPPEVRLLKHLILPDESRYSFQYDMGSTVCSEALVSEMTLPTMGKIEYTYRAYTPPPDDLCSPMGPHRYSPGLATRTVDGKEWKYDQDYGKADLLQPPMVLCGPQEQVIYTDSPRWARTRVLSPPDATAPTNTRARTRSDHYFSVFPVVIRKIDPTLLAHDTNIFQYGEPIVAGYLGNSEAGNTPPPAFPTLSDVVATDDGQPASVNNRSLTRQLWADCDEDGDCNTLVRSEYQRYKGMNPPWKEPRELVSDRTVFNEDPCSSCYLQTDRDLYTGTGRFREIRRSSNFPQSGDTPATPRTIESTYTSFVTFPSQVLNPSQLWNLNLYEHQTRTVNGQTSTTTACFDSLGRLTRTGVLSGTTAGGQANDLVTEYTYSGANLENERSYGGDGSNLSAATPLCNTSLGTAKYRNRYEWSYGVMNTSRYVDMATGLDLSFKTTDYTVSPGTGMIVASRAVDELETKYEYEPWGRLTKVTPPGETPTTYSVTNATISTPATIVATRDPSGGPNDDVTTTFEYDRLGRSQRTKRTLPGAGCVEQVVTYDQPGRKNDESVWKPCDTSADATVFRYDASDRVKSVKAPDDTETLITYKGIREQTRTVSIATGTAGQTTNATTTERYDALGRLVSVSERSGPSDINGTHASPVTTTYQYDVGDRLTSVLMTGVETGQPTQPRTFQYDRRGFLLSESHPESGITRYENYDARGHAEFKKVTPTHSLWNLKFQYDPAERITHVYSGSPWWAPPQSPSTQYRIHKKFVFETDNDTSASPINRTKGKLVEATRENYAAWSDQNAGVGTWYGVVETYDYQTTSGRPSHRNTRIIGRDYNLLLKSIDQEFTYNSLGLTDEVNYPICDLCAVPNIGNPERDLAPTYQRGMVTALPGYLDSVTYAPHGGLKTQVHTNGITDTIAEDPDKMARPRSFKFESWSECGAQPAFSVEPQDGPVDGDGTATLTASASGGTISYQWYEQSSGEPIPGETGQNFTTPVLSETTSYYVRVTNACRSINSRVATVTVDPCQAADITANPAASTQISQGQTAPLSVIASGTDALTFQWYEGLSGNTSTPVGANADEYSTPQLPVGTRNYWVRVSNPCGSADSTTAAVTVTQGFEAPANVTATRISSSAIEVSWQAVSGAGQYKIRRRVDGGPFTQVHVATGTSWQDPNVVAGKTYVYAVRAANSSGGQESGDGNYDLATMMTFAAVTTGATVNQSHVQQLLDGVNAVRAAGGSAALTWSNLPSGVPAPSSNVPIRRDHVAWLRERMNDALQLLQIFTPAFDNADLQQQPAVRAVHIQQLQQRTQ